MSPSRPAIAGMPLSSILTILLLAASTHGGEAGTDRRTVRAVFVEEGSPKLVREEGGAWKRGAGWLEGVGTGRYLRALRGAGRGAVRMTARLTLVQLEHTAASIALEDGSHFGFDGADRRLFVSGPRLGGPVRLLGPASEHITAGRPFMVEILRAGSTLTWRIDGRTIWEGPDPGGRFGTVALRPWRATMRVHDFALEAEELVPLPPTSAMPDGYTLPIVDLSGDAGRQVVVAQGTKDVYQGHPTTLLLGDGRTMFCAWSRDHGGPCGPLKRSDDGGRTWSEAIEVPESWTRVRNCPSIHSIHGPDGVERLFVFAGNGKMMQSVSLDRGRTWSPMRPNGLHCIVAPITILPVAGGARHIMLYHRGLGDRDRPPLEIWQSASSDGGRTWTETRRVCAVEGACPCEPAMVRSPDGKQILCLMRENARRLNSLMMVSNDEGQTWSEARELPASLTGDRHMPRYAADGRLVVTFRDMARSSPTRGHFVAWVGTYDDIVRGREGQYRVLLLRHHGRFGDTGYAGLERLPDGTLAATTYVARRPGERNSVVSVRFRLEEVDALARQQPRRTALWTSGEGGYHTYRIPAIIATGSGTLLAFCEGRKESRSDAGDIDLLWRRSTDGGETWSESRVLWDDGPNTCGNPCPVLDESSGTIWLLLTHNLGGDREREIIAGTSEGTRTVWVSDSTDDGRTWSRPREITRTTKRPDWTWYATGPGMGIQLRAGPHRGRLVVPCDHIEAASKKYYSHVIVSDDHGKTWRLGGRSPVDAVNECQVAELSDGRLVLNMRNYDRSQRARAVATSRDGGESWTDFRHDDTLVEPICQAALLRLPDGPDLPTGARDALLFSNPASATARVDLTVRLSLDGGRTWPVARLLFAGPSAYSSLAALPDAIACLHESGDRSPYEAIWLSRFPRSWILPSPGSDADGPRDVETSRPQESRSDPDA